MLLWTRDEPLFPGTSPQPASTGLLHPRIHTPNGSHRHERCRGLLRSSSVEVLKRQQRLGFLSHERLPSREYPTPRRGSSPNQTQPWPSCPADREQRVRPRRQHLNHLDRAVVGMIWTMCPSSSCCALKPMLVAVVDSLLLVASSIHVFLRAPSLNV